MKIDWQERTKLLLGKKHEKLSQANILIVGLGGVGGIVAEMLCRAGIEKMTIVDGDEIETTNLNRQILTTNDKIGEFKANVLAEKLRSINPEMKLSIIKQYIKDVEMQKLLETDKFDYVVDAIDTIAPKVQLITQCVNLGLKIVSSMGSGGKLNPTMVQVDDISKSYNCKLARMVRKKIHKRGITTGFKAVFSSEKKLDESLVLVESMNKKSNLGTISYMPAIFGLYATWVVIDELAGDNGV